MELVCRKALNLSTLGRDHGWIEVTVFVWAAGNIGLGLLTNNKPAGYRLQSPRRRVKIILKNLDSSEVFHITT